MISEELAERIAERIAEIISKETHSQPNDPMYPTGWKWLGKKRIKELILLEMKAVEDKPKVLRTTVNQEDKYGSR